MNEIVSQDQLRQEIAPVVSQAHGIIINSAETHKGAIDFLRDIKGAADRVVEFFGPMKKAADESHKRICAAEKEFLVHLIDAEETVKKKAILYRREEEEKREEERRKLQAEADEAARKERERLEKRAANLKTPEKREALLAEAAEIKAPVIEAPAVERVSGVSVPKIWHAVVTDASLIPEEYKIPDMDTLNKIAKAMKDRMNIPGVKAEYKENLRVKKERV